MHTTPDQAQPELLPACQLQAQAFAEATDAADAARPQGPAAEDARGVGFRIGWDHAHHALVPPPEHLRGDTAVLQGWLAGRAAYGARTLAATRWVRWWLQWRLQAWQDGIAWEAVQLTPHYLSQLHTARCPVLRQPLNGQPGHDLGAVLERLNPLAGYAAGNLAVMSRAAARARRGQRVQDLVRRARQAERLGEAVDGLLAAAWWRLAALAGLTLPPQALPFHQAAQLPLAVLPPNRVRVLGPATGLQALLTHSFALPGWAARARRIAGWLPAHSLRHDFNLFVGAIAPRLLEAPRDTAGQRQALEDAWLQERVQRRWQHFLLSLGEAGCEALLAQAVQEGLAGMTTLAWAQEQAVEGWALTSSAPAPAAARGRPERRRSAAGGASLRAQDVHGAAAPPHARARALCATLS